MKPSPLFTTPRLAAYCRRFRFELMKSIGLLWLIDKTHFLKIREPWNKLYKRSKLTKY